MKRIYICVTACELRLLDATKIYHYFLKNGNQIVYKPEEADIIFYVTCGFSEIQSKNVYDKIREFQKYDADLIVAGCVPEIEPGKLAEIFKGRTISTKGLNKIDDLFPDHKIKFGDVDDANVPFSFLYGEKISQELRRTKPVIAIKNFFGKISWIKNLYKNFNDHIYKNIFYVKALLSRFLTNKPFYMIRISWGCPCNCSYCAAKKAVGPIHSKSLDQCINEFKKGLEKGHKNFILNADDSGAYGIDIGSSFPELLDEMTKIPGDYEISILNFNPVWIIKYIDQLEEILKRKKITSLEIPIQSSNSRVLKLMNRFSDVEKMKEAFLRLKKAYPDLAIVVHYILGFPTETQEEFQQSLDFIRELDFDAGYYFIFSSRAGTVAAGITPKIPQEEISMRLKHAKKYLEKIGYTVMISKISSVIFTKKDFLIKSVRNKI